MSILWRHSAEDGSVGQAIATICLGIFSLVLSDVMAKWLDKCVQPTNEMKDA